jgi:hypothetical protein
VPLWQKKYERLEVRNRMIELSFILPLTILILKMMRERILFLLALGFVLTLIVIQIIMIKRNMDEIEYNKKLIEYNRHILKELAKESEGKRVQVSDHYPVAVISNLIPYKQF